MYLLYCCISFIFIFYLLNRCCEALGLPWKLLHFHLITYLKSLIIYSITIIFGRAFVLNHKTQSPEKIKLEFHRAILFLNNFFY